MNALADIARQVNVEVCDGVDNDCDMVDEGVVNRCGDCAAPPEEICNAIDDDCDDRIDEGLVGVGDEVCNGRDDDCDRMVDEGLRMTAASAAPSYGAM